MSYFRSAAGEVRLEEVCLAERIGSGASSTVYRVRQLKAAGSRFTFDLLRKSPCSIDMPHCVPVTAGCLLLPVTQRPCHRF